MDSHKVRFSLKQDMHHLNIIFNICYHLNIWITQIPYHFCIHNSSLVYIIRLSNRNQMCLWLLKQYVRRQRRLPKQKKLQKSTIKNIPEHRSKIQCDSATPCLHPWRKPNYSLNEKNNNTRSHSSLS